MKKGTQNFSKKTRLLNTVLQTHKWRKYCGSLLISLLRKTMILIAIYDHGREKENGGSEAKPPEDLWKQACSS